MPVLGEKGYGSVIQGFVEIARMERELEKMENRSMVILDGKVVENSVITPEKHRFIGTFRFPSVDQAVKFSSEAMAVSIAYAHQARSAWQEGKLDLPQYVTARQVYDCVRHIGSPCSVCGSCSEPGMSV